MTDRPIEDRVAMLEREFEEFKHRFGQLKPHDWRATFGMFADDPEFDEVLRLGREIRQRENDAQNP